MEKPARVRRPLRGSGDVHLQSQALLLEPCGGKHEQVGESAWGFDLVTSQEVSGLKFRGRPRP